MELLELSYNDKKLYETYKKVFSDESITAFIFKNVEKYGFQCEYYYHNITFRKIIFGFDINYAINVKNQIVTLTKNVFESGGSHRIIDRYSYNKEISFIEIDELNKSLQEMINDIVGVTNE